MKKLSLVSTMASVLVVGANASMSYECSFEATGGSIAQGSYVKVLANSKSEAEQKARAKIKDLRGSSAVIKYIRCK